MSEPPLRRLFAPTLVVDEPRTPDPVDRHVGARLAAFRKNRGLSQTDLGARLGLSFQQIQKYETGTNRISSSRLWAAGLALGVQISDFFAGLPDAGKSRARTGQMLEALEREAGRLPPDDQRLMLAIARRLSRKAPA